ncbi:MAG: CDP-paratose 2-epimerase, partial [Candidatus Hydrogenedentota bacterium]
LAAANRDTVAGKIYNVGGGPDRSMAVWTEFGPMLEELLGANIATASGPWRPGDQPVFISDISAIQRDLGWSPRTPVKEGLASLVEWVRTNREVLEELGL